MHNSPPRKKTRKEMIIAAATVLFRERGYGGTSMRDLAEEIGIEAASLYNHIKGKSEILKVIVDRISNDCIEDLARIEKTNEPALKKLELFTRSHINMILYRFEEYSVMMSEWVHLEEPLLQQFVVERKKYVARVEQIVQMGIIKMEIKPLLPYGVVLNILSSVRGLEYWHRGNKIYNPKDLENTMIEQLIGGLKR